MPKQPNGTPGKMPPAPSVTGARKEHRDSGAPPSPTNLLVASETNARSNREGNSYTLLNLARCCSLRSSKREDWQPKPSRQNAEPLMSKFDKEPNLHCDPLKMLRRCAPTAAIVATVAVFATAPSARTQTSAQDQGSAETKIPHLGS